MHRAPFVLLLFDPPTRVCLKCNIVVSVMINAHHAGKDRLRVWPPLNEFIKTLEIIVNGSPLFFIQFWILGFDGVRQFARLKEADEKKLDEFSSLPLLVLRQGQHQVNYKEKRDKLEQQRKYLKNIAYP
jgi:hypothetical protein